MTERRIRRDLDVLSERRRGAMILLDEGMSQADVARELGVSRQTVSRWARLKDEYPDDAAWHSRRLGRPGGLTDKQKEAIVKTLADRYVREFGTEHAVRWTLERVAALMESEFGVSYSLVQVRNILIGLFGDDPPRCRFFSPFWTQVIERAYPELTGRVRLHVPSKYRKDRAVMLGMRDRLLTVWADRLKQ